MLKSPIPLLSPRPVAAGAEGAVRLKVLHFNLRSGIGQVSLDRTARCR